MKITFLKVLAAILSALVIGVIVIFIYLQVILPRVGEAPDIKITASPEMVQRGEYLANHVMLCMDCHGFREWNKFSGPMKPGSGGSGGEIFDQKFGFPGSFTAKNITPANLSNWTDGEIFRAITTGVNKDGEAFFPVMPYKYYGQLDQEDIEAVIAYVRSLPAIEKEVPESKADFPFNLILNTIPEKANLQKRPSPSNEVEYGKYMATAAACMECHTRQEKGKVVGEIFAGGFEFNLGNGTVVRSQNLTPHASGIGNWTKEAFIKRFKMYVDSAYSLPDVNLANKEFQTVMPWTMYAGMTEEDLGAIYEYLRTITPVDNKVEKFTASLN
jgi:mono/diheme cytochrome c family protein